MADWKSIFGLVSQIPVVRRAIGATLEELEHNPDFQKFVEKYQAMSSNAARKAGDKPVDCMICLFHKYGVDNGLNTLYQAPRHRCANHDGAWFP